MMNKAEFMQNIQKIRFKNGHFGATLIILIFSRYSQGVAEPWQNRLPQARVLWHYKMCLFDTSWASRAGAYRESTNADDVDGNRSDERHLARRGRCRLDRDRWQAGEGVRTNRLPALHPERTWAVAPGPDGSRQPAAARCAPGHPARGRAGGDGCACPSGGRLYPAKPPLAPRRRYCPLSPPDRAAPAGPKAVLARRRAHRTRQGHPYPGHA